MSMMNHTQFSCTYNQPPTAALSLWQGRARDRKRKNFCFFWHNVQCFNVVYETKISSLFCPKGVAEYKTFTIWIGMLNARARSLAHINISGVIQRSQPIKVDCFSCTFWISKKRFTENNQRKTFYINKYRYEFVGPGKCLDFVDLGQEKQKNEHNLPIMPFGRARGLNWLYHNTDRNPFRFNLERRKKMSTQYAFVQSRARSTDEERGKKLMAKFFFLD